MYLPKFRITNKTLRNVAAGEAAAAVVEVLPLAPVWEIKLREEALVRQIYFSLKAEGGRLAATEVEKIVREEPLRNELPEKIGKQAGVKAEGRVIQEVMNLRNALKIVEQWAVMQQRRGTDFVYNKEQLLQIQTLTMEKLIPVEEIGRWRMVQIPSKGRGEYVYKPASAVEVPYQVEDLFTWLNSKEAKELHPIIKMAVVDFELMRIQPFREGSDLVTKIVDFMILAVERVDQKRIFCFEEERERNLSEYWRFFVHAQQNGDLTYLIELVSELLRMEAEEMVKKVKKLSVDTQVRGSLGKQIALNEREIKLIEFMEAKPADSAGKPADSAGKGWLTMNEIRGILAEVSDDTILRDLKDLIKKEIIRKKGKTKGAKYSLKVKA